MENKYHVEILKDGKHFVARIELPNGKKKEFRDENLEDVLTQMVTELQEELDE
jgi:hypothetical protein